MRRAPRAPVSISAARVHAAGRAPRLRPNRERVQSRRRHRNRDQERHHRLHHRTRETASACAPVRGDRAPPQRIEVVGAHRQQQVEIHKVKIGDASRTLGAQIVTACLCRALGPRIGSFADMVGMCSGRVEREALPQPQPFGKAACHPFRGGRAADVPGAHKKNTKLAQSTSPRLKQFFDGSARSLASPCQ